MEANDKQKIQKNIQNARDNQEQQRPRGITDRAQNAAADIENQQSRDPRKIDPQVLRGLIKDIRRCGHQPKQWPDRQNPHDRKQDAH